MDKEFDALFSGDLVGTLLNRHATNLVLSLAEDGDQKEMLQKLFTAFNRHGVSTYTVIQVFADMFKEGDLDGW